MVKINMEPPKPKPPKTIVQQVKNMDKKSIHAKEQGAFVINRIFAVFKSWELFSDE
jgi:3-hydroxyacyl-CoA dehydrogenase